MFSASPGGGRHVNDQQGIEIDPALLEVGGEERTASGLNPSRGLSCELGVQEHPHCSRGPSAADVGIAIAGELQDATGFHGLAQGAGVRGVGDSRFGFGCSDRGQAKQGSGHPGRVADSMFSVNARAWIRARPGPPPTRLVWPGRRSLADVPARFPTSPAAPGRPIRPGIGARSSPRGIPRATRSSAARSAHLASQNHRGNVGTT